MAPAGEHTCGLSADGGETASVAYDPDCPACNDGYLTPPPESPRGDGTQILDRWRALAAEPPRAGTLPDVPGYEVFEELGRGGMGVVYRARQHALDRTVALKMILAGAVAGPAQVDRLRAEAMAAARMRHPNIVRIYDAGTTGERPYLVMEYVNGGSLAAYLVRSNVSPSTAAALVAVLAGAMDYAHRIGVIHRDLKPANVLLELCTGTDSPGALDLEIDAKPARAVPKVSDFSLAKLLDSDDDLTRTGAILGTPCYMSPEQASGTEREVGPAADIYALGAILYEALCGRPPFRGATMLETLERVRTADPIPPRQYAPKLPRDLQTICLKCLDKNPARRYASAAELAADLERFALGRPILARPVGSAEQVARWARRRPTAAALVAVCVLAVASSVVGLIVHNDRLRAALVKLRFQEAETRLQKSTALANVVKGQRALEEIFTSLDNPPVGLSGNAAFRTMYEDQANAILRYYREILDGGDGDDPDVRFARGMVSVYSGRMQLRLGHDRDAEGDFRRAIDLLEPLDRSPEHRRELAQSRYWYGTLLLKLNRTDEAEACFERSDAILAELRSTGPTPEPDGRASALCQTRLCEISLVRGEYGAARRIAEEAIARWDRLIASGANRDIYLSWKAIALRHLAYSHLVSHRWDELAATARRASEALGHFARNPPPRRAGLTAMSFLVETVRFEAHGRLARNEAAAAIEGLTEAFDAMESAVRLDPQYGETRTVLSRLYRDRAFAKTAAWHAADARPDWDRAVDFGEGEQVSIYRIERAMAWLKPGELDRSVEELKRVAETGPHSAYLAGELARAFARASDIAGQDSAATPNEVELRRSELANAAVDWLGRAVAAGLVPNRDSFQQLIAEPPFVSVRSLPGFAKRIDDLQPPAR